MMINLARDLRGMIRPEQAQGKRPQLSKKSAATKSASGAGGIGATRRLAGIG